MDEDDHRTPLHRLLDKLIHESDVKDDNLRDFVYHRRAQGWSWGRITHSIHTVTSERVTTPTLIDWFTNDEAMTTAYRTAVQAT